LVESKNENDFSRCRRTFVVEGEGIYKPLWDLLENYSSRKIFLTNANDGQIVEFGLVNLPYELFTLKHKPDKTDPAYFREMLGHYGLGVKDVVYFEHSPEAVKSAESVGIKSHYYDADKRDLKTLKKFLDENLP